LTEESPIPTTSVFRKAFFLLVILLAGFFMILWTWNVWGDFIIDFGRELYIPWQLSSGKALYLDISYRHGPLSPYFNALAFSFLGPSLRSLMLVNLLLLATLCWLLYVLISHISDRRSALVCLFLFLLLFAFAVCHRLTNFNYLTPYSHEMTHGMLLSILTLWIFQKWLESGRTRWLLGCGSLIGLLFSMRPEMFFAVVVAVTAGISLMVWKKQMIARRALKSVVLMTSWMLLVGLGCFALLCTQMPWPLALQGALGGWWYLLNPEASGQYIYKVWAGTLQPFRNMFVALLWLSIWLGTFAIAIRSARKSSVPSTAHEKRLDVLLLSVVLMCIIASLLFSNPLGVFSALPVLLVIVIVFGLERLRYNNDVKTFQKLTGAIVFSVFSLLLLTRMILRTRISHYGFVLAMPGVLVLILVMVYWVENDIRRRGWKVWEFELIVGCFLLLMIVVPHFLVMYNVISLKRFPVGQPPNQFLDFKSRAPALNETLSLIQSRIKENETLAVWPEGVALNFVAQRANPTRFISLIHPVLLREGESEVLNSYATHPPDFILLIHRPDSEFGAGGFGEGYGRNLLAWLWQNYVATDQVGARPLSGENEFGALLLRRHDLAHAANVHRRLE